MDGTSHKLFGPRQAPRTEQIDHNTGQRGLAAHGHAAAHTEGLTGNVI